MTLFEILAYDKRALVYSDPETMCIYTWDKALTLQAWTKFNSQAEDNWEEVDKCVLAKTPKSYDEARMHAMKWIDS